MNPLSTIWRYILTGLTALGAVAGFFFYAKREGRKDEQAEETAKALEQAKEASDVNARVRAMSDHELDERLRVSRRPPPK